MAMVILDNPADRDEYHIEDYILNLKTIYRQITIHQEKYGIKDSNHNLS